MTMAMFILHEGLIDFNKACKGAQDIDKYLKRYPFKKKSPSVMYDVEYVEDELNVSQIVQLDR